MSNRKYGIQFTTFMVALLGIVIILLLHRTPGIEHDARLYLAQGFLHRYHDIFSQDFIFLIR